MHHLLVMEELGGDKEFQDRFLAQHMAFFYYWFVIVLYSVAPAVAYNINQHVEEHASATYTSYLADNEEWLRTQPPAAAAVEYYGSDPDRVSEREKVPSLLTAFSSPHMPMPQILSFP